MQTKPNIAPEKTSNRVPLNPFRHVPRFYRPREEPDSHKTSIFVAEYREEYWSIIRPPIWKEISLAHPAGRASKGLWNCSQMTSGRDISNPDGSIAHKDVQEQNVSRTHGSAFAALTKNGSWSAFYPWDSALQRDHIGFILWGKWAFAGMDVPP